MGQPTHTITQHAGRSQLWERGPFCAPTSLLSGPLTGTLSRVIRTIAVLVARPFLVPAAHMWHARRPALRSFVRNYRACFFWEPFPLAPEGSALWRRYFRVNPDTYLFMDEGRPVVELGYTIPSAPVVHLWAHTRVISVKGTAIFLLRGLPAYQQAASALDFKLAGQRAKPKHLRPEISLFKLYGLSLHAGLFRPEAVSRGARACPPLWL